MMAYANGYVHCTTRIAIDATSLNNMTFTEEQNKIYYYNCR